jgi:hypothetical protein
MKSIKRFKIGLKQIIIEMAVGLLTTLILLFFTHFGFFSENVKLFVNIFIIIGNILLIRSMLSWGIFYTLGWLIGSFIFFQFGWVQSWEIIVYLVLPVAVLIARLSLVVKKKLEA